MKKRLLAALIGVGAGLVVAGAYVGVWRAGVRVPPEFVMAAAAALVFAGAVAVFALLALDKPAASGSKATLLLTDDVAKAFIFYFEGEQTLSLLARPDMSVGEVLVKFGDVFKKPPAEDTRNVSLTLKGGRKTPFNTLKLQQLFGALGPFKLEHVLLMSDDSKFVGYIPGKRALKEFSGRDAAARISTYIVEVLADPSKNVVLRELSGVTSDDTISETEDTSLAEAKIWRNDALAGLVVHRQLKPVGYISKVDVLRVNAGRS